MTKKILLFLGLLPVIWLSGAILASIVLFVFDYRCGISPETQALADHARTLEEACRTAHPDAQGCVLVYLPVHEGAGTGGAK